jgi:hypothetical protein
LPEKGVGNEQEKIQFRTNHQNTSRG